MAKRLSSEERRKEILNTSLEIIYDKGFYNLTMRNIADKIGISEAAVYRHFKNKEEIIDRLANKFFCHDQDIEKETHKQNTGEKLKGIMKKQMEIFSENPLITVITFQEEIFRAYPDIWNEFNQHLKERELMLVDIIKNGQARGEVDKTVDPEAFAVLFMGAIRMTVIKWRGSDFSYSIIEKGEKVFQELAKLLKVNE